MTDISRRNFLKVSMAAAGIAAVGLPVAAEVAEAAAVASPRLPLAMEIGDVWLKSNDVWRFVGKAAQVSIRREPVLVDFGDPYGENVFPNPPRMNLQIFRDKEGLRLLGEMFNGGEPGEIVIGCGPNLSVRRTVYLVSCSTSDVNRDADDPVLDDVQFEIT